MKSRIRQNGAGPNLLNDWFRRFAQRTAEVSGSPWVFFLALVVVAVWALSGPIFHYSDTWQLIINTGTTILTFLMVFLIQNTQNRDAKAIHLKLDELIRAVKGARNNLVDLENLSDQELLDLQKQFQKVRKHAEKVTGTSVVADEVHADTVHVDKIEAREVKEKGRD